MYKNERQKKFTKCENKQYPLIPRYSGIRRISTELSLSDAKHMEKIVFILNSTICDSVRLVDPIMDSSKIGRTSRGQGMGTSALGLGWFWREKSRR